MPPRMADPADLGLVKHSRKTAKTKKARTTAAS